MDVIGIFELSNLKDLWFDNDGLLTEAVPVIHAPNRPKRGLFFAARLAGAALAFNMATAVYAAPESTQLSFAWPTSMAPLTARQTLADSLRDLRSLKFGWNGRGAVAPIERALSAAQYILPQLPNVVADARAGVDPEGNVFIRYHRGAQLAYLTVEPKSMHLLYIEPGKPNVYVDDAQFNGKVIPADIKKILDDHLKS